MPHITEAIMTIAGIAAAGGIVLETFLSGDTTDTIVINLAPDHRVDRHAIEHIALSRRHHHRHVQARWQWRWDQWRRRSRISHRQACYQQSHDATPVVVWC